MPESFESEALVLDRIPYREGDLILTLLTRDQGLVSVMARSGRNSRKRFGGVLDLFTVFRARWSATGRGGLSVLNGADPVLQYPGIFESFERLQTGQALLVMTRDLLRDAPVGEGAFERVVGAFAALEGAMPDRAHVVVPAHAIGLLEEMGHGPSSRRCPDCGRTIGEVGRGMSWSTGHVLCVDCGQKYPDARPTSIDSFDETLDREDALSIAALLVSDALGRSYRLCLDAER
jgi:DNA repair protein RecO (recombination protein O)